MEGGDIYKNMTLVFEDISGVLEIKGKLNYNQFPANMFFAASAPEPTVLRMIFRRIGLVKIPYMMLTNTDVSSKMMIMVRDTKTTFSVAR